MSLYFQNIFGSKKEKQSLLLLSPLVSSKFKIKNFKAFYYEKFQLHIKFERIIYCISEYSLPSFNNYQLMGNSIFLFM